MTTPHKAANRKPAGPDEVTLGFEEPVVSPTRLDAASVIHARLRVNPGVVQIQRHACTRVGADRTAMVRYIFLGSETGGSMSSSRGAAGAERDTHRGREPGESLLCLWPPVHERKSDRPWPPSPTSHLKRHFRSYRDSAAFRRTLSIINGAVIPH